MAKPALKRSGHDVSSPPLPAPDEIDNDELRRRLAGAGSGIGYDRRDSEPSRREPHKRMVLDVPVSVHDQVRIRAAEQNRTINSVVLECLAKSGFDIPASALVADRRQSR